MKDKKVYSEKEACALMEAAIDLARLWLSMGREVSSKHVVDVLMKVAKS